MTSPFSLFSEGEASWSLPNIKSFPDSFVHSRAGQPGLLGVLGDPVGQIPHPPPGALQNISLNMTVLQVNITAFSQQLRRGRTFFLLSVLFTLILGVSTSSSSSMKSFTPHLGFCIISTVSLSSRPVTSRPAKCWNLETAWWGLSVRFSF